MLKFRLLVAASAAFALLPATSVSAAVLGPDAARCVQGAGPAVLVRITGLKNRAGTVRIRSFAGAMPKSWFNKKMALKRTQVDIPAGGPVEVCMPVANPGSYVFDLRHDMNNNGDTDKADGAGASGNPEMSFFDFLLGKKPPASKVVVTVGTGVSTINIVAKYLQNGKFKPVGG